MKPAVYFWLVFMCFQECSNIFSKGGGEELAKLTGSIFLGKISGIQVHAL